MSGGHKEGETNEQLKTMMKNSPALQEALVRFLSITGQGISTWESMSNNTSDEIKKECANEMTKQQILKIRHDNAKMMKELTEMKSLSSLSSTCPAHDILCKSTNVKILSAPSCHHLKMKMRKTKKKEDIYT